LVACPGRAYIRRQLEITQTKNTKSSCFPASNINFADMAFLYLDSNIISYLHHPEDYPSEPWRQDVPVILSYINEIPDLRVLYSSAHLMDVRKGYLNDQQRALEKLGFISYLTCNRRIANYFHSGQVTVEDINPEVFFLQETENNVEFHAPGRRKLNYLPQFPQAYHPWIPRNSCFCNEILPRS
jgi:hypothetical protein